MVHLLVSAVRLTAILLSVGLFINGGVLSTIWMENPVYLTPVSPFGKLRDKLLNREIFTALEEAKILIEQWRRGTST
jgi:hypothetical protein